MVGLKLNHVSKRGPCSLSTTVTFRVALVRFVLSAFGSKSQKLWDLLWQDPSAYVLWHFLREVCWQFATIGLLICICSNFKCPYGDKFKSRRPQTQSKGRDLYSMIIVTGQCFGAASDVCAIGACMIAGDQDLVCPDWLDWWFPIKSNWQY